MIKIDAQIQNSAQCIQLTVRVHSVNGASDIEMEYLDLVMEQFKVADQRFKERHEGELNKDKTIEFSHEVRREQKPPTPPPNEIQS